MATRQGPDRRAGRNDDHGDGDRVDIVRELGRRGREIIDKSHRDGQAALDADKARAEQQSQR